MDLHWIPNTWLRINKLPEGDIGYALKWVEGSCLIGPIIIFCSSFSCQSPEIPQATVEMFFFCIVCSLQTADPKENYWVCSHFVL